MDTIKKAMYVGLGAISLTKEKAEDIIDDLVKRGEASGNDRAAMVATLLKEAELQNGALEGRVAASVKKIVADIGLPTKTDFQNIVKRLDGIEKAIPTKKRDRQGTKA